jgi:hypothetical protein
VLDTSRGKSPLYASAIIAVAGTITLASLELKLRQIGFVLSQNKYAEVKQLLFSIYHASTLFSDASAFRGD